MWKKECTDGAWPCEMSTHLAAVESENFRLKSILADIRKADIERYMETGKFLYDDEMRKRIHDAI